MTKSQTPGGAAAPPAPMSRTPMVETKSQNLLHVKLGHEGGGQVKH